MPKSPPSFDTLTYHPSLEKFSVPVPALRVSCGINSIAVGAVVLRDSRILLVQRAASDTLPLLWETPGGASDAEDRSVLHAAARELWEESGLVAGNARRVVTCASSSSRSIFKSKDGLGHVFPSSRGNLILRYSFELDIAAARPGKDDGDKDDDKEDGRYDVVLDPQEHCNFVWATKQEVQDGRCVRGGRTIQLDMTSAAQRFIILQAFCQADRGRGEGSNINNNDEHAPKRVSSNPVNW